MDISVQGSFPESPRWDWLDGTSPHYLNHHSRWNEDKPPKVLKRGNPNCNLSGYGGHYCKHNPDTGYFECKCGYVYDPGIIQFDSIVGAEDSIMKSKNLGQKRGAAAHYAD